MARSGSSLVWAGALGLLVATGALGGRVVQLEPVRVAGASMSPALEAGDVVFVSRRETTLGAGDIALAEGRGRGRVLHRVVGRDPEGGWITRGDANPVPDLEPVQDSAIVGRVVCVLRTGEFARRWRQVVGDATLPNQSNSSRR